jgi:hypothetical protein
MPKYAVDIYLDRDMEKQRGAKKLLVARYEVRRRNTLFEIQYKSGFSCFQLATEGRKVTIFSRQKDPVSPGQAPWIFDTGTPWCTRVARYCVSEFSSDRHWYMLLLKR